MAPENPFIAKGISRREFLRGTTVLALSGIAPQIPGLDSGDLALINGRIHTMDPNNRIVSQVLIRNGRFIAVGNGIVPTGGNTRVVDLMGKTVIPGIIDAHNHIVLVGNRPGWHTPLEHVFTIQDAVWELKAAAAVTVPEGEFITTIGPISARQFQEQRLPNLTDLDAIDRPV